MLITIIDLLEKVQAINTELDAELKRHSDLFRFLKKKTLGSNSSLEAVTLPLPTNVATTIHPKEPINFMETESGMQEDDDEDYDEEDSDDEDYDDYDDEDSEDEDDVNMKSGSFKSRVCSAGKPILSEESYFNRHPGKLDYFDQICNPSEDIHGFANFLF